MHILPRILPRVLQDHRRLTNSFVPGYHVSALVATFSVSVNRLFEDHSNGALPERRSGIRGDLSGLHGSNREYCHRSAGSVLRYFLNG